MTEWREQFLVALAWPDGPPPEAVRRLADDDWRVEPVLPDQGALDRAGSRGRTPPPFQALGWHAAPTNQTLRGAVPDTVREATSRCAALRVLEHPAWDDTVAAGLTPQIKQVSFLKAQPDLTMDGFTRHFREHVAVARVHHPAICRYAQHDVLETLGDPPLDVQGVSELWFADEASLVERYFAGPDSVAVVRADNREYIDFSGTLSLLVRPVDAAGGSA
jgi:hypothetical protein